jgi:Ca2+-binding RTX toxin-like protein
MATIEVRVSFLEDYPLFPPHHHAYIVITRDDGSQTYLRGGPTAQGDPGDALGSNSSSSFGNIVNVSGAYVPGTIDWAEPGVDASRIVFSGTDSQVQALEQQMLARLNEINNAHIAYNPFSQNSNSVVGELLEAGGLPRVLPDLPGGNEAWAPAFDHDLPASDLGPGAYELLKDYLDWGIENEIVRPLGDWWDGFKDLLDYVGDAARNTGGAIREGIEDFFDEAGDLIGGLSDWLDGAGQDFSDAIAAALRRLVDPIVLDLDGDGVELLARADSNVFFDMDGDGRKELTGWVGKDDGLLVIDQDNDGSIESIDELIGDLGRSGFAELATHDSNHDGVISSADADWSKLKVWVDADTDGVTDAGELKTMAQAGIKTIDLNFTTVNFTAEGNRIHEQATFEKTDGTVGTIVDAWFDVDNVTTARDAALTGNATIDALPDVPGSGDLPSLRVAMLADGALLSLVSSIVSRTSAQLGGVIETVEQALYRWAGAHNVDPNSRGGLFDARALVTLERILGTPFIAGGNTNPNAQALAELNSSWDSIVKGMAARLLLAGPLGNLLPNTVYSSEVDRIITLDSPAALLEQLSKGVPSGDVVQKTGFWTAAAIVVDAISEERGANTASSEYRALLGDALAPYGLGAFGDLVGNGIQQLPSFADNVITSDGMFRLTAGADTILVQTGHTAIFADGGNDYVAVLDGWTWTVSLFGGAGNDTLLGSFGDDWLDGESGIDSMRGGQGDDTYVIDNAADAIGEAAFGGTDAVRATVSYVLPSNVEHLTLLGTLALNGTGNAGSNELRGNPAANVLKGLEGNDLLDGGAGADRLEGGSGADLYVVDNAGDLVVETGSDFDTVRSSVSFVAPPLVEQVELQGTANINVTGNALNNWLFGNAGANVLNGGAGPDAMYGGKGNDTYIVDDSEQIVEGVGEGTDTVQASVSHNLWGNVETLVLTGSAAIDGVGNELANTITGNGAANRLDGGAGGDRMAGGAGDDLYVVDSGGDVVSELALGGRDTVETQLAAYTLGAEVENLRLYVYGQVYDTTARNGTGNALANVIEGNNGINTIDGLAGDDTLYGRDGDDVLKGGLGNDLLEGGNGADRMAGGAGNDLYLVTEAADQVTELLSEGTDTVRSMVSYILGTNLETLELVGSGDMDGRGNALNNRLVGNAWANNLDGSTGADVMIGDDGNDTYTVDNAGDQVIESLGAGTDLVRSSINYTLGIGVENLTLLGTSAQTGIGNELGNTIAGNSIANVLKGHAGSDVIDGGAGADKLYGGSGTDQLTGGAGADSFYFEASLNPSNADTIVDFSVVDDTIQLNRSIFAAITADGTLAASAFRVGGSAQDADDRIIYDPGSGNLYYDEDGSGALSAALFARLAPGLAITNADFVAFSG